MPDSLPPGATLDPDLLEQFTGTLAASGFTMTDADPATWIGPLPDALRPFTDASEMEIRIRAGWPYQPPAVLVDGIASWHANRDHLCLWQEGDNTRSWATLAGILSRIDEWVEQREQGFPGPGSVSLDLHLYFERINAATALLDLSDFREAGKGREQGLLHAVELGAGRVWAVRPGRGAQPGPGDLRKISGRWFRPAALDVPPRTLSDFQQVLTEKQRFYLRKDLATDGFYLYILFCKTTQGEAPLIVFVHANDGAIAAASVAPTPTDQRDRLRRAGPDAEQLAAKAVVIFGVGAIGSHVARLLAQSGIGSIVCVDGDILWPVGWVRHASDATVIPVPKADAMKTSLSRFDWTAVEADQCAPWAPDALAKRIHKADLCIDATGNGAFSELLARVTEQEEVPFVAAALFRGGAIARVRRQADGDVPIAERLDDWRYPPIPPANDEHDFLGAEVGCAAPIHNAPPVTVVRAASLASLVCVDLLMGRSQLPDEVVELYRPLEPPYDQIGLLRGDPIPPSILMTEAAIATVRSAAREQHPNEAGGILLGYLVRGLPAVTGVVSIASANPSPAAYELPAGTVSQAVDAARERDQLIGYLGEWHSHPTDQTASPVDIDQMRSLARAGDAGTPILLVLRPQGEELFALEGFVASADGLTPTPIVDTGDLDPSTSTESST